MSIIVSLYNSCITQIVSHRCICHATYMCADRHLYVHPFSHTHCISHTRANVYMYQCIHTHINAHAHTWICHVYMYICICVHQRCIMCIYVHTHRCTHAPVHYVHMYIGECVCACARVPARVCEWACAYLCVYTYVYVWMNALTRACLWGQLYWVLYICELVNTYEPIMSIMLFIHDKKSSFVSDNVYHVICSWTK